MVVNEFVKSHGLGNDYIVLDSKKIDFTLTPKAIVRICDVHFGIGTDGILLKVPSEVADFGLKIFNPDASEAEKSGNGLRIFCKYLYDYNHTKGNTTFTVETLGGIVTANIIEIKDGKAFEIKIDMGTAIFKASDVPVISQQEECLLEEITIQGKPLKINCVSVGNPHCVVLVDDLSKDDLFEYGPLLEKHEKFPNKINVQFAKVVNRNKVEVLIWERGAGHTLASGSSSCAVGCVCKKHNLVDEDIEIHMEGGVLILNIDNDFNIKMQGEVREIARGILSEELIRDCE